MIKKESKKILVSLFISVLMISLFSGFVSAQGTGTPISNLFSSGFFKNTATSLNDFFMNLSPENNPGFLKLLFFILVFLITINLVKFIPGIGQGMMSWVVALAVTFLGIFFLPVTLIKSIIVPYQAWGATLLTIIPFILLFAWVKSLKNNFLKSLSWFIFSLILIGLFISSDLKTQAGSSGSNLVSWIYGFGVIAAAVMCLGGKKIEKLIWAGRLEETVDSVKKRNQILRNHKRTQTQEAINESRDASQQMAEFERSTKEEF